MFYQGCLRVAKLLDNYACLSVGIDSLKGYYSHSFTSRYLFTYLNFPYPSHPPNFLILFHQHLYKKREHQPNTNYFKTA